VLHSRQRRRASVDAKLSPSRCARSHLDRKSCARRSAQRRRMRLYQRCTGLRMRAVESAAFMDLGRLGWIPPATGYLGGGRVQMSLVAVNVVLEAMLVAGIHDIQRRDTADSSPNLCVKAPMEMCISCHGCSVLRGNQSCRPEIPTDDCERREGFTRGVAAFTLNPALINPAHI
jgi:hypothetical protein